MFHGADSNGSGLANALYAFVSECKEKRDLCLKHNQTAAIHPKGKIFQLYRMYQAQSDTVDYMRTASEAMSLWEDANMHDFEGAEWNKVMHQVEARMGKVRRSKELFPVLTKPTVFNGRPVLVHAYKFEADPRMKIELLIPDTKASQPEFALDTVFTALQCHEFLIPSYVAEPRPPYEGHEADFSTITEYLSQRMPKDLYDLCCFPPHRVSVP